MLIVTRYYCYYFLLLYYFALNLKVVIVDFR